MNKKHLQEKAEYLYVERFYTFIAIAQELELSERTVRSWAKKGDWDAKRKSRIEDENTLLEGSREVAKGLLDIIREELRNKKQPPKHILEAYSRITASLSRIKEFEDSERTPEKSDSLSEEAKDALKKAFGI